MKAALLYFFSGFLLLYSFDLQAQEPVHWRFTNEQGLPSSEVYDVLQDRHGYMWFATDQGIVRYDGYNFEIFDENVGLPENTVFDLELDKQGNIWVNTIRGHLAYFDGENIQPYRYNYVLDSLYALKPTQVSLFKTYHIFSPDSIVINIEGQDFVSIDGKGTVHKPYGESQSSINQLFLLDGSKVLIQGVTYNHTGKFIIHTPKGSFTLELPRQKAYINTKQIKALHYKNSLFLTSDNQIYEIDFEGNIIRSKSFPSNIYALNIDKHDNIWIGTAANGVYRFSDFSLEADPLHFFKNITASSFGFDHEGGVWITSLNKGVFYIPLTNNYFYNRQSGQDFENVKDVFIDSKGVCWLALSRGRLGRLTPDKKIEVIELDSKSQFEINDILYHPQSQSILVATTSYLYSLKEQAETSTKKYQIQLISSKENKEFYRTTFNLFIDKNGTLWSGQYDGLYRFDSNLDVLYSSSKNANFDIRIGDVSQVGDTIYIATLTGLYSFHDNEFKHLGNEYPLLNKRITDIFAINDTLFIGTKANGLLMLVNKTLSQFDISKDLASNTVKAIGANQDYLLIGTNNGISLIKRSAFKQGKSFISHTINSGMLANEINAIESYDGFFYLATSRGLQVFKAECFSKSDIHMPVYLTNLLVNHKSEEIIKKIKIPHSKNDIQLDYFALSFRDRGKQTYRHRLLGLEDDWIINHMTTAQYPYLPAGQYIFEVSVLNSNGIWNPNPARLHILVLKPYWAKPWFRVLVVILLMGIILTFFFWRVKVIKMRKQLLYDINWYQQEALINQMNPHFLFNSLNTVHRYVLQNDRLASSRYLTKFANLMRKILENSQERSITIANEKEALNLYLELESARFKDKFDYQIHIDESIPAKLVKIPVFIVQPLVENAIWHGLMQSDKAGRIDVSFERINDADLKVKVSDNGIGREEAEKYTNKHKKSHKTSLGIPIIKRRIELINIQERTAIWLSYKDLKAPDGTASGTEVSVYFPYFLKDMPQKKDIDFFKDSIPTDTD